MQAVRFVGAGQPFPLNQAFDVYEKLKAGQITGRAVLVPDAA